MDRSSKTRITLERWLAVTAMLVLMQLGPASAATNCNSGVLFSSDAVLSQDYEQTVAGTACITLTNGADLNMNGHKITCKGTYIGSCNIAIRAIGSGSRVYNGTAGSVAIDASSDATGWGTGVLNAQIVEDMRIDRAFLGISSTASTKIAGNVITRAVTCVEATLSANTSLIQDNLCDTNMVDPPGDPATTGITATGTTSGNGPTIQRNMVMHANFGIYANNRMRIEDNIVSHPVPYFGFGVNVVVDAGQSQTGSNNLCCEAPEDATNDACTLPHEMAANFHLWP